MKPYIIRTTSSGTEHADRLYLVIAPNSRAALNRVLDQPDVHQANTPIACTLEEAQQHKERGVPAIACGWINEDNPLRSLL